MLQMWIVSFIVGVLLARVRRVDAALEVGGVYLRDWLLLGATWPVLLGCSALLFSLRRRLSRRTIAAACATGGLLWGFGNAAPFPPPTLTGGAGATVIKVAAPDAAGGPVLVRLGAGADVFEVSGVQRIGAAGVVRALATDRLFGVTRGLLQASPADEEAGTSGFLGRAKQIVRDFAHRRSAALPRFYQQWLAGLVMGEKAELPVAVRDAFKRTGLYHLLVVSGLHVSIMALLLAALLRAPAHLAYSLRLIDPFVWRHLSAALQVLAASAALLYLAVTGSPAAAQRAALLFVVLQLSLVFYGGLPLTTRLQLAAAAQILIFPVGFVGEGTLMSWTAYLLVLRPLATTMHGPWGWSRLRACLPLGLRVQVGLTALVAAVFGQLALVGLAANLVLIPVFPLLLISGLAVYFMPELPWAPLCLAIQQSYIGVVRLFDGLCDVWPWLSVPPDELSVGLRLLCLGLSAWILLNACRDLSIRPTGSQAVGR